ncbi:flagellar filament capping protein FliD [Paenibacillus radicis (ex Xue et al. 2023)]|uniref:Flagellar hook-associated protein 2 n=1 Tax=Paenibacillus radicis (ex Xue et al. 2023) TaxID=2972489 RepID=A0ABT1YGS7_9BACL|nr:flagellar filament capping protein FliD [Paenibacillus radicis (ex Xue et al. 2023)]MCR8632393.1 flagellar filament capping protein FliD [Paenibacillus radicis (ex Xue et al. 2023)]
MVMRISGLSSGFDTDGTVTKLMQAKRVPLDKLGQKKQTVEWQRDAYREINTKVTEFRNTKLFNFKAESTFNAKTVTITGNTDAVTAKGTASAINTNLLIKVDGLAVAASKVSEDTITTDGFNPTATLASQSAKFVNSPVTGNYSIKINGTQISVDSSKDSLNDVISKINKNTNVTAFYDSAEKKISFMSNATGKTNGADGKGDVITFEGSLLTDVFKVNTNQATGRIAGADAQVTINGLSTTRTSNVFTFNGVEVTLKKSGGSVSTISTKPDTDKIVESIKSFISDYNDILKIVNDKSTETKNSDYAPLTDAQKEALSEKQIESWENKAKAGLLRNDPILASITRTLRSNISAIVDSGSSKYNSLASIGIDTGQYFENGKLYLNNETKLREAIEANPEAVKAIFTGDATDDNPAKAGVGERLYSQLNTGLTSLTTKAGLANISYDDSLLSKQISLIAKDMTVMQKRLATIEDNYYKQFSAMETALDKLNSQGSQLISQMAGK